jgi:3-oxoacyl-[acyl-carrier-protein] synthase-3
VIVEGVGILGTGVWCGVPLETGADAGGGASAPGAVRDPYLGRLGDDGVVRVAGMELTERDHPRTLAALRATFADPRRGTRRKRVFPDDLEVAQAEVDAARRALDDARLEPADVGALLVQSFLPDTLQPRNAARVAHGLGITAAPAWEVDSVCNSALSQLSVASSLVVSGFASNVLCVQSTAYSRLSDPGSSSAIQEGDLATAFVVGRSDGSRSAFSWRTDGRLHAAIRLEWRARGDDVAPPRWWRRPEERLAIAFEPVLRAEVMHEIADNARTVCDEALARAELAASDVDILIAHQPMSWNRAFMEDVLRLRPGVAYDTFEEYASVNSCGIPASIAHARREGRLARGTRALLFGPAAGYTYGAAAVRW